MQNALLLAPAAARRLRDHRAARGALEPGRVSGISDGSVAPQYGHAVRSLVE